MQDELILVLKSISRSLHVLALVELQRRRDELTEKRRRLEERQKKEENGNEQGKI